ncbi:calmodulin-binding protein [Thalassoglobus sp. JC818]|uniref:BP74-related protein n=1 Tax=Thalassoglobus sp. JC818 TaxID=3232136 RepID=UPI0034583FFF
MSTTETAYFRFTDTDGQPRFVIQLHDPEKIKLARRILSGDEREKVHVQGTIMKSPAPYNPGWSYHLDPETIDFFGYAIEVCDAAIQYVEDHLDEVGGATLPNSHWCPWSSSLVDEVNADGDPVQ